MRILFVDDESRILTGIENAPIFAYDDREADFANSGEEAVALLSEKPYDVLVTDMKMPGLTGADVLEHAKSTRPGIVRLILSGEVDPALAERAMPLIHEFVPKPCDPDELFGIIDRVYMTSRLLEDVRFATSSGRSTSCHRSRSSICGSRTASSGARVATPSVRSSRPIWPSPRR